MKKSIIELLASFQVFQKFLWGQYITNELIETKFSEFLTGFLKIHNTQ